jgi:hypothetical protein
MTGSARDEYLATIDPGRVPLVRELDRLVTAAGPGLEVAVKYRMLTYTLYGRYHAWVVAIDAHPRAAVGLRFLFGALLHAPPGLLRPGRSGLSTLAIASLDVVDAELVSRLVAEATTRHAELQAAWKARETASSA